MVVDQTSQPREGKIYGLRKHTDVFSPTIILAMANSTHLALERKVSSMMSVRRHEHPGFRGAWIV